MTARSRERMMPETNRNRITDDIMEQERLVGLIDERGDVADVDRLLEIGQLARFAQAVEELPEILLHAWPNPIPQFRLVFS